MDIFEFMNQFFGKEEVNFSDQIGQKWEKDAKGYTKQKRIEKDGNVVEIYEHVVTNDPNLQKELEQNQEFEVEKIEEGQKLPRPIPEDA